LGIGGRVAGRSLTRNLAAQECVMHQAIMRRLIPFATLALAACATRPQQPPETAIPQQPVIRPVQTYEPGSLIGLSASEVVAHLGHPALQIREGTSLKLQFRSPRCVLDAYLYPSGSNSELRVSHVDARLPSGSDMDQAACVSALENPS
jgi:hypothetical protein